MAYLPGRRHDFLFTPEPYQPSTDFSFYPEQTYPFQTPPSVISTFKSQWQTGQNRQQTRQSLYGTSVTINTRRQQTSQQASPIEARANGLFLGKMPDLQAMVQSSHRESTRKENHTAQHWQQLSAQERKQANLWDSSILQRDEQTTEQWHTGIATDRHQTERFDRVDEYSPVIRQTQTGYSVAPPSLLNYE